MHVLIVRNNSNPQALDASYLLTAYFSAQSIGFTMLEAAQISGSALRRRDRRTLAQEIDLAVVLGGDGTILHTARLLEGSSTPILGINFGRLGFLANECEDGVVDMVARALAGELKVERRANLRVDVVCEGERDPYDDELCEDDDEASEFDGAFDEQLRDKLGDETFGVNVEGRYGVRTFFALNEVVVARGAMGRIIDFTLDISDHRMARMRGDGMVIATATGSTAYALSAGGPLVAPGFAGLVTVPLAPHTLRARAILTGESDVVCVTLDGKDASREATLFVDGDMLVFDQPVRRVYTRRGDVPTTLLRASGENFYSYASEVFF